MDDHRVVLDLSHIVCGKPQRLPVGAARLIKQPKVAGIKYSALSIRMVELHPRVITKPAASVMFVSSASACQCCVHGPREILHKASERTGGAFLEALRRVRPARLLTPAKTLLEGGTGSLGIVE